MTLDHKKIFFATVCLGIAASAAAINMLDWRVIWDGNGGTRIEKKQQRLIEAGDIDDSNASW
jgi:hypothetical protein